MSDEEDMVKSLSTYMKNAPFTRQNQPLVLKTNTIFESVNELLEVLSPEEGAVPSSHEANLPPNNMNTSNCSQVGHKRPSIDKLESFKIPKIKKPGSIEKEREAKNSTLASGNCQGKASSSKIHPSKHKNECQSEPSNKKKKCETISSKNSSHSKPKSLDKPSSKSKAKASEISHNEIRESRPVKRKKPNQANSTENLNSSRSSSSSSSSIISKGKKETESLNSSSSSSSIISIGKKDGEKSRKKIKIKKEVLSDDEILYRPLKTRGQIQKRKNLKVSAFVDLTKDAIPKSATISTCTTKWETVCDLNLRIEPVKATVTVEESLHTATSFQPEILYDVLEFINLVEDSQISEKECAAKILGFIFKCHKLFEMKRQFDVVVTEMHNCYPSKIEENLSQVPTAKIMLLGRDLLSCLDPFYVKNLNFGRFLEIVVSKIKEEYGVKMKTSEVLYLLLEMLEPNQQFCFTILQKEILYKSKVFFKALKMKQEKEETVVFTQQQLELLGQQIRTYLVLVERQRSLERVENELSLWQITKEVKQELRSMEDDVPTSLAIKQERLDQIVDNNLDVVYVVEDED